MDMMADVDEANKNKQNKKQKTTTIVVFTVTRPTSLKPHNCKRVFPNFSKKTIYKPNKNW